MAENDDAPKIFVDSDWKAEAQKTKEQLDRETREMPKPGEIPPPSILELVQMVVMQASVGLGGYQDPATGQRIAPDLGVARHYIDLLQLLADKTDGRLNEEEKGVIDGTLHELRMVYVQIAQALGGSGMPPGPGAEGPTIGS
jgi:hypothetical protein